jgi:DNA-binding transcriptional ArsR family regulator
LKPGSDTQRPLRRADVDRIFHALGDPTRRAILETLSKGPVSVSKLAEPLGVTLAAVIQHLDVLETCRVVKTEKLGRVRTCTLVPGGLSTAERWISERRTQWEERFDRLGDILSEDE